MRLICTQCQHRFNEDDGLTTEMPGDCGCPECQSFRTMVYDNDSFADEEDIGPDEEDIVINDKNEASYSGKLIASGENVRTLVRAWMDSNQWWPNVWFISDHGNPHLVTDI